MHSPLQFSELESSLNVSLNLIYKTFLYELPESYPISCSVTCTPSLHRGLFFMQEAPLDLYTFFSSPAVQKLAYYTNQCLSIGVKKQHSFWLYYFYTPHSTALLEQLCILFTQTFPDVCCEWLSPDAFFPSDLTEITFLSSIPPLDFQPTSTLMTSIDTFTLLMILTPLPVPTLTQLTTEVQDLHRDMGPFSELTRSHTCTDTSTCSDTANHAHSKSSTENNSNSDGNTLTDNTSSSGTNNISINYKGNDRTSIAYSLNENCYESNTNTLTNNITASTSNQSSCNYANNSSKGCTHTHSQQTSFKSFHIQTRRTLSDAEQLLEYYLAIRPLVNYEIATYFMSSFPLQSIVTASTYSSLINPTPSVVYPEFVNTVNTCCTTFDCVYQNLLSVQHPYFCITNDNKLASPALICSNKQLPALFKPISPL